MNDTLEVSAAVRAALRLLTIGETLAE